MKLAVGIDPDTFKSGVAVWNRDERKLELKTTKTFFELFDYLKENRSRIYVVRVEAGWLHGKSNWTSRNTNKFAGERIAKNVGSNHETGRKIIEMCQYLDIHHEEVLPLGKVSRPYFEAVTKIKNTNQDVRDAIMLVWEFDPKPVKFKSLTQGC
jgi:hypothetical protein